jgi:magnesium chelatase family protein
MLAKVCSAAANGIEAYPVEVEVNVSYGETIIVAVGWPNIAFKEGRNRAGCRGHREVQEGQDARR